MPEAPTWQRVSPLSVLFFFGRAIKRLVGNMAQMAGSIGALVVVLRTENVALAVAGVAALLALLAGAAVLRYWCFRFALEDDGLRIRQGVFKKTHLDIQFDRVQGVDVERSVIYRMLGMATVTFDTAGSAGREAQLPAVADAFVTELRGRVERTQGADAAQAAQAPAEPEPLVRLGAADMVRIGVTDPSVLLGLAALPVLYQAYEETLELLLADVFEAASAELVEVGMWFGLLLFLAALLVGFIVLVALMIASAFLRFNDYELLEDGTALRSRAGLLTRREVAMERAKIQQLHLAQGIVMRMLGYARLRMLPATSGAPSGNATPVGAQVLNVPLLHLGLVSGLKRRVFGAEAERLPVHPGEGFARISPLYIRARVLAVGVVPALAGAAGLLPVFGMIALVVLIWPLLVAFLAWRAWRRRGFCYDDDGLASRAGLIGVSVDAFLFRKAQGATLRRSPLQRRHGLATLTVHLASGNVTVPYIDYATACRLRDYLLFKVASSRRPWH